MRGTLERITFRNEETGFSVLRIRIEGGIETAHVVGTCPAVVPGERLTARGRWVSDPARGRQFHAAGIAIEPPSGRAAVETWLGSGAIRGVGPHLASKLWETFAEKIFEVLDGAPEKLLKVPGIGRKRLSDIRASWDEQRGSRELMLFLQEHGVGTARATRIWKEYGADAVRLIRENPYRLADEIRGIGFTSADVLAQRLGVPRDSEMRIRAGIAWALEEAAAGGHCALPREELIALGARLLGVPHDKLEQALELEIRERRVLIEPIGGRPAAFLPRLLLAEKRVAERLRTLAAGPPPWRIVVDRAIEWVEPRLGLRLAPSQKLAIARSLGARVSIITGGPGVGKTTIVRAILAILEAKKMQIVLAAPTGRAAKRLGEASGRDASTIHRLLEVDRRSGTFLRNEKDPLRCDLAIIDEVSMLDITLMDSLLRAIPRHAGLLLVGDADQLPSVGPGQVLADLIASGAFAVSELTEIHRQAAGSRIVINAHRVNRGEMPLAAAAGEESDFFLIEAADGEKAQKKILELVTERIPKRFGFDGRRDVQVLSPMHRGDAGVQSLNAALQRAVNPEAAQGGLDRPGWVLAPGDKVMQIENDYEKDVFNGDLGIVRAIDRRNRKATVEFEGRLVDYAGTDLDSLTLAYATTIHKSQGSEYPAVVIALLREHSIMLQRNLLYTAITRGRRLVVLVGQSRAVEMAVRNAESRRRWSGLRERLLEAAPEP
ncbi:MAG TPA: ATP-dependent RecD-like DNA helicase [Thermoanaerobaculia bacterium]|nr:ATP-dependent RecD-like DNA helicase [Thermoanaerobaculia bacterium]